MRCDAAMAVHRPCFVAPNAQLHTAAGPRPPVLRTIRPHGSSDWLLIYTIGGSGVIRSPAGEELLLTPGMAVLYPATCPHDYATSDAREWHVVWAHFLPRDGWHDLLKWPMVLGGPRVLTVGGENQQRIEQQLALMDAAYHSPGRRDEQLAMSALEVALLLFDRVNGRAGVAVDPRVLKAMEAIRLEPSLAADLTRLARGAGLSPSRFAHLFRDGAGMSPGRWAELVRLRAAVSLLLSTDEPIGAIAERVGYADQFYFSTRFRRRFGASPRDFRARGR
jgi:AraC family transcriptional regulator of arabinose operon